MKILFRADANTTIGLGHVQRSLSLAIALRKQGVESLFLTNPSNSQPKRISSLGFSVEILPFQESWSSADARAVFEIASQRDCAAVVVDSHQASADYLDEVGRAGIFVAVRDDLALFPFSCQLVINGNADAKGLPYRSSTGDTEFLLGPEYAVLREEFEYITPLRGSSNVSNVLVILGGTDGYDLMPRILSHLDTMSGEFRVTAVIGPFFHNTAAVRSVAADSVRQISLVEAPESVHDLMLNADLAVSAAGQALYELGCTGCPTVAISVATNQEGQLSAFKDAGALLSAGDAGSGEIIAELDKHLRVCLADEGVRTGLASAGQRLVDGKGAQRVARALVTQVDQRSKTKTNSHSN